MRPLARIFLCGLAGLAAGAGAAGLSFPGYLHAMVALGPGARSAPLRIDGSRRQTLALSLTGLGAVREVDIRMPGAEISSWYPPVVRLPFNKVPYFSGGRFLGVEPGRKLPVYVAFEDDWTVRSIEILDAADGSLISSVAVTHGRADGQHHH